MIPAGRLRGDDAAAPPSGRYAFEELVENLDHLRARPGTVRRFRDIQGRLVAGPHEHVRERRRRLPADAPGLDSLRQQRLYQPEHVLLAYLPPAPPAQDRRPVDEGDAVNLRLDADLQPLPHGMAQGVDRVRDP